MATLVKVPRKSGYAWKAVIRRNRLKPITKTFARKTDARAWAQRIEADEEQCRALGNPKAAGFTVSKVIDGYMSRYNGRDRDHARLLHFWNQRIGDLKINEVTSDHIMDVRDELLGENGKRCGKQRKRSGSTVNRYVSAISAVFRYAIEQRILKPGANPAVGIPRGKEKHRFGRALSDSERDALLEACKASEWPLLYLLVLLAVSTGARKSELLGLTWNDLDLSKRICVLVDTKNGQPGTLLLLETVIRELKRLPRPLEGTVRLFPRSTDPYKAITPHNLYRYWKTAQATAGIKNFHLHDLRHSAASYLVEAGVPLVTVAEIPGHRTLAMVQRYSHIATQHKLDVIENALSGKLG